LVVGSADYGRAGPVAEQNGDVPAFVRKIERARMNLGAHEQDALVHARFDKGVRYLKPVEKPRALLPYV